MRILFAILANAAILVALRWLLPYDVNLGGVQAPALLPLAGGGWKTYLIGGLVLGLVGAFLRPVLTLIGLPFRLVFFGLTVLVINGLILMFFTALMGWLSFPDAAYDIKGVGSFLLAVAIFTVFNTLYGAFFKKK